MEGAVVLSGLGALYNMLSMGSHARDVYKAGRAAYKPTPAKRTITRWATGGTRRRRYYPRNNAVKHYEFPSYDINAVKRFEFPNFSRVRSKDLMIVPKTSIAAKAFGRSRRRPWRSIGSRSTGFGRRWTRTRYYKPRRFYRRRYRRRY